MLGDSDERTPLLQEQFPGQFPVSYEQSETNLGDTYKQFCLLVGNDPADQPPSSISNPPKETLYYRALQQRKKQAFIYALTRALTNTLLLAQIVLGAALTGLGAANSPGWLITIFGAANTVIAGLVAFLKSRGQPMRARMFRDDLDRVVDEIENSATMWRGISQGAHGYDAIDTDDAVTVRSEVARLTRLYDRAVKTNTMNDPDHYGSGISMDDAQRGLRARTGQAFPSNQPQLPTTGTAVPDAMPVPVLPADESPATQIPAVAPTEHTEAAQDNLPVPPSSGESVTVPGNKDPSKSVPPPAAAQQSNDTNIGSEDESPATSAKIGRLKNKPEDQSSGDKVDPAETKSPETKVNGEVISR